MPMFFCLLVSQLQLSPCHSMVNDYVPFVPVDCVPVVPWFVPTDKMGSFEFDSMSDALYNRNKE